MKKVLAVLAALAMMLSVACPMLFAQADSEQAAPADVIYTIETVETAGIAAGETFTVNVSTNALEKICMVEFFFAYDATKVKATSATVEGFLAAFAMKNSNVAPQNTKLQDETIGEVWITGMALSDGVAAEGDVISTITFEALVDITEDVPMYCFQTPLAAYAPAVPMTCAFVDGGVKIVTAPTTTTTTEGDADVTTTTTEGDADITTTTDADITTSTDADITTSTDADITTSTDADVTTSTDADVTTTIVTTTEATTTLPDGDVVYIISTYEAESIKAGETFEIQVSTGDVEKICMVEFFFAYDATKVKATSATVEGFLANFAMKNSNVAPVNTKLKDETIGEVWITGMDLSDGTAKSGDVISTITFEAKVDITEDIEIYCFQTPLAAYAPAVPLNCAFVNGGVDILGAEPVTTTTTEAAPTTTTTVAPTTTTTVAPTTTTTEVAPTTTTTVACEHVDADNDGNCDVCGKLFVPPVATTTTTVTDETTTTTTVTDETTTTTVVTTAASAATTTAAKTTAAVPDAPKTDGFSDAMLYFIIACMGAAVVLVSTVASKAASR